MNDHAILKFELESLKDSVKSVLSDRNEEIQKIIIQSVEKSLQKNG